MGGGVMTTRAQILELELWLTEQPDVRIDYSFDSFGFWYSAKVRERFIRSGAYYRDRVTLLDAVRSYVEAVREKPELGTLHPPAEHTRVFGPGDEGGANG